MKRLGGWMWGLAAVLLFAWGATVWADGYRVTVGTNPIVVVPAAGPIAAPAWAATNVYSQGAYVKTDLDQIYMSLVAGTSGTNRPGGGPTVADGTVTWVSCLAKARRGASISVDGADGPVYVSLGGQLAAMPAGIRLNASGGNLTISGSDAIQTAIKAATSTGTNVLVIATW